MTTTQWRRWGLNSRPFGLSQSLYHWATALPKEKTATTMLKTLSLEMTATQRSCGPLLKQRNVIAAVLPIEKRWCCYSDPQVKANILKDQFAGAFTEGDTSSQPSLGPSPCPDVPVFKVGTAGVKKLLRGLKPHKASGPDNLPIRFLKEAANELAPALCLILTASLNQGYVPDDWKTADGTPIFNKGDWSKPANYRPISLSAVCCKVMEHILNSQVIKHLDLHNILSDNQHGFRKKQSCESQLILTIQDIVSGLEDGEQIDAILLDFSKALDKVPHQRLLLKLKHYGIRDYWVKQRFSSIASFFKWELLLKERICTQTERILSFMSSFL